MATWIKDPLAILATGAERGLVIDGARIVELVPAGKEPVTRCEHVVDASAHVVLPGLINTHHHFYQTLTRACPAALDRELFDWLKALYPVWEGLNPQAHRLASQLAMAELLLSGCTTAVDHHYVFPEGLEDAIDIQMEVAAELGLRVHLTRGSMNLSVADGGLPPRGVVQKHDEILADSERLIARWHDAGDGAMRRVALAPCSPFSVSRELMRDIAGLARLRDVRLHTHLGETEDENAFCLSSFGMRPLDYLEECGWLDGRTWIAHGIHFTEAEIQRLGAAKLGIAHCPGSNLLLSSGLCRTVELEAAGCPVGLAVDGSASQDASNLMQEVRLAFQLGRLRKGPSVSHLDALRWATKGGAGCLGRDDIGELAPGKQADIAMFRLDELRFSGHGDPIAALVLCGAHRADRVYVAGRVAVEDGHIPGLDVKALMTAHQAEANRLQGLSPRNPKSILQNMETSNA